MHKSSSQPLLMALLLIAISLTGIAPSARKADSNALAHSHSDPQGFVMYEADNQILCREASDEEARYMVLSDPDLPLHVISRAQLEPEDKPGLKIIMQATEQMENHLEAKACFLRAAAIWESLIQDPITITIDVDFGLTFFGMPFPSGVVGLATGQLIGGFNFPPSYSDLRNKLIERASSEQEADLYRLLPSTSLPTDLGGTESVVVPTPIARALGFLNPVADPETETELGQSPRIGFLSAAFPNGDCFEYLALHEIGHVLGFFSNNGSSSPVLMPWDLFRFRPGVTLSSFAAAPRIFSVGGEQVFFAGGAEKPLSTGGFGGEGGDGFQSSHWKGTLWTGGVPIGIMEPSGGGGVITVDDLIALNFMGLRVSNSLPVINRSRVVWEIRGDELILTGKATDPDGDIAQARVILLDEINNILHQSDLLPAEFNPAANDLTVRLRGINNFPSALFGQLILFDSEGNRSPPARADFREVANPAPYILDASFNGAALKIRGQQLIKQSEIEINGVIVAPPRRIKVKGSGAVLKVKGNANELGLRSGHNRIRVLRDGLSSRLVVLTFAN